MIQALLARPFSGESLERFRDIDGYEYIYGENPTREQLANAEVILGQPTGDEIRQAPALKWIQITSAGSDHYTKNAELFQNGLCLTNLSGAFGTSISEFALTMALMLYKHMHLYRDQQRAHIWKDAGWQQSPEGKNLLILGAGNIGTAVAKRFRPFHCHITGMRRVPREIPPEFDEMITTDGLDAALAQADIVVAALPDTAATHKLLNRERLRLMKKTAILVNVGRGGLIDHDALAEALMEKRILGAAVDVTDPEPLPPEHPLWDCSNAIITPHITGGSFGHLQATEDALYALCRENLVRYRDGKPLLNVVDFETGYRVTENRAD